MPCKFCELIEKTGSAIVRSDAHHVVVRDRRPKAKIHLLVIPRRHVADLPLLADEEVSRLFTYVTSLIRELKLTDYRVHVNAGRRQGIRHLHVHVMADD